MARNRSKRPRSPAVICTGITPLPLENRFRRSLDGPSAAPISDSRGRPLRPLASYSARSAATLSTRVPVAITGRPRSLPTSCFASEPETNRPQLRAAGLAPSVEHRAGLALSYFLWASMPDEELLDAAAKGELRNRRYSLHKCAAC